jgi:hypothetical protein
VATIEQILDVFSVFTERLSARTPAGPCQARAALTRSKTRAHLGFGAASWHPQRHVRRCTLLLLSVLPRPGPNQREDLLPVGPILAARGWKHC